MHILLNMNHKENQQITSLTFKVGKLEGKMCGLESKIEGVQKRLDEFIDNEFKHLRTKVDQILWTVIIGTLLAIIIAIVTSWLKIIPK